MKHDLDQNQLRELLNGVSPAQLTKLNYSFSGNHAGYGFIARIEAAPDVLAQIIGNSEYADSREVDAEFRKFDFERCRASPNGLPEWLDLPWEKPLLEYQNSGSNSFTSKFDCHFYYDRDRNILYLSSGGI